MKLFAVLAIALTAVAGVAVASDYRTTPYTITNGIDNTYLTNVVAAATTNSSLAVLIPSKSHNTVALSIRTKLAGAGTSAINYIMNGTVDGTNFSTANKRTLVVTPAGTITVNTVTNIDCTGFAAFQIHTIQNVNGEILTNLQFDVGYKNPVDTIGIP